MNLRGATATLLLVAWSPFALASSGIETDSKEVSEELPTPELPTPSLNVENSKHGLVDADADADMTIAGPANKDIVLPALVEDTETDGTTDEDGAISVSDPPETALRLPGVAEEDQPRFRRQMYRTDI